MTVTAEVPRFASFRELRELACSHPDISMVVDLRSRQVADADWDIIPTSKASRAYWGKVPLLRAYSSRRKEALRFFGNPDPDYGTLAGWLRQIAEDLLVIDAVAMRLRRTRAPGCGLLGSDLASLQLLDGATVEPCCDPYGRAAGCAQYLEEVPRRSFAGMAAGPADAELAARFGSKDVLYLRIGARAGAPFGFSPLERALTLREDGSTDAEATAVKFRKLVNDEWVLSCRRFLGVAFSRILVGCGGTDLRWTWEDGIL